MMPRVASHIPAEGTKQYMLLRSLLAGEKVDPFIALMEFNLPTLNARASELRRLGWPVRAMKVAHPKLKNEKVVVFFLDEHFRRWIAANPDTHPDQYPSQEGRGKFAKG